MTINRDRRGAIDIYHGEPQSNLLQTIRDTMSHEGFRRMTVRALSGSILNRLHGALTGTR